MISHGILFRGLVADECLSYVSDEEGKSQAGSIFQLLRIPSVCIVCIAVAIGTLAWAILDPTLQPHLVQVRAVLAIQQYLLPLTFTHVLLVFSFAVQPERHIGWIGVSVDVCVLRDFVSHLGLGGRQNGKLTFLWTAIVFSSQPEIVVVVRPSAIHG